MMLRRAVENGRVARFANRFGKASQCESERQIRSPLVSVAAVLELASRARDNVVHR
jgi:hypothetical protein